jgi:cyclopropane fatty-acyl-phospholipid synthase-like methyltransferase
MVWDKNYSQDKKIWGEQPSELTLFTCTYLKNSPRSQNELHILDAGCGYGQNAVYLAKNLNCYILGVDNSCEAIALARESCPEDLKKRIEFLCYDFKDVIDKYDVIFVSNLYQVLKPEEREKLKDTVKRCLNNDGLLFLNTLSVSDPHHNENGTPVSGEANSFQDGKYIHLSTRNELESDFGFLTINALFEREFSENHSNGNNHHHISWIMMGNMK